MLTETQTLKELNKWSDWDMGTLNSATVSHSGGGPLPGSGASGGFAVPLQRNSIQPHRSPCDSWSPVMWGPYKGAVQSLNFISQTEKTSAAWEQAATSPSCNHPHPSQALPALMALPSPC